MENPFDVIMGELRALKQDVAQLQNSPAKKAADRDIIDREELGRRLGISDPTIIQYTKKGIIPEIRIGATIRYDYAMVLESLQSKKTARYGRK